MKIIFQSLLLLFFSLQFLSAKAQLGEIPAEQLNGGCGNDKIDPALLPESLYLSAYQRYINSSANQRQTDELIYKLPVVIHVIYPSECEEVSSVRYKYFPTDELIRFEIEEASQRFRHKYPGAKSYTNPYYGIDTKIELQLATVDPNGQFTSGIERIVDPQVGGMPWGQTYPLIDKYKWDTKKYCNIFIVKSMTDAAGVYVPENDYTIYRADQFWSGIMNHELGHYLSLYHTFETMTWGTSGCPSNSDCLQKGDLVCDTPPKYQAGAWDDLCKGDLYNSCSNDEEDHSTNNPYRPIALGGMGDQPDFTNNYMDYNGPCWDSYTLGQKIRMLAQMETRTDMIDFSADAFNTPSPAYYLYVKNVNLVKDDCPTKYNPVVEVENKGTSTLTSAKIKILNGTSIISQFEWMGSLAPGQSIEIKLPELATESEFYYLKAEFENPNNLSEKIYQTSYGKQLDFTNYNIGTSISIPFNACRDFELGSITNDVDLKWTTEVGKQYYGYSPCRECKAVLVNKNSEPYLTQNATFELETQDFTTFNRPELSFLFAYYPYENSGPYDTLSLNVSAECNPFETVWLATGLDLATNNPIAYETNLFFFRPGGCDNNKTITVNLAKYAGKKDVRIEFEANGKFMTPLILDDITIDDKEVTAVSNVIENQKLIRSNITENELIINPIKELQSYQIITLTGQIILQTNNTTINVSKLNPGIYLLVAEDNDKRIIEKFVKH